MDAPRIELSTPIVAAGFFRNLLIEDWRGRGTIAELDRLHALQRDYLRRAPGQLVTFSVVHAAAIGPIDRDMRHALERTAREIHPQQRAGALVVLGGGFGGAIVRSLLTGINFLRRMSFPNTVVDSVAAGCEFVSDYVEGAPGPRAIEEAYRALALSR